MSEPSEDQVRALASLVGIEIAAADLPEVTRRFASLMHELQRLVDLDLADIEPRPVFPEET